MKIRRCKTAFFFLLSCGLFCTSAKAQTSVLEKQFVPKFTQERTSPFVLGWGRCMTADDYPKSSVKNEETGTTSIYLLVAANGQLIEKTITKSSGFKALDNATKVGFARCRYMPGSVNGIAVQSPFAIEFTWKLD